MTGPSAGLLLLTDGRFPAGGYAHSGGLEPSVEAGRVHDVPTLESFLIGRAVSTGAVAAAFAAAAGTAFAERDVTALEALDAELDARMPSPAQRATSRQLGRQFVRALGRIRPDVALESLGATPHLPIAQGAGAAAFELASLDAALAALYESVAGPAAAAVRVLSLDPFSTYAALGRLAPLLDDLARHAVERSRGPIEDLPAWGAPLLDVSAEQHAVREMRLFAS